MKKSSLFCFHKRTAFRKKLIMIVLGGTNKPLFNSVDELVNFYTQRISKKRTKLINMPLDTVLSDSESS